MFKHLYETMLPVLSGAPWRVDMPEYNAPLRDMRFVMDELLDMTGSYAAYGLEDATPDLVSAILE